MPGTSTVSRLGLAMAGFAYGVVVAALALGAALGGHGFTSPIPTILAPVLVAPAAAVWFDDRSRLRRPILATVLAAASLVDAFAVAAFLLWDTASQVAAPAAIVCFIVWLFTWVLWQVPLVRELL